MHFRFDSERQLLEAVSAYYGVIEDADLIQSLLPAADPPPPDGTDPPRDAAKLRVTLGIAALRLLRMQGADDPSKVPPSCEIARHAIRCSRCVRPLPSPARPEAQTDRPRFHRCQCGRILIEFPSAAHPVDQDAFQRALEKLSPETWHALLDQVMAAQELEEGEKGDDGALV